MKDVLYYQDFIGSVHYSAEDTVFYGKIEGVNDLVTFEGESVEELTRAFEEAVEDYIDLCSRTGKPLRKSYKGSFNVRIDPDLHRKAVLAAQKRGVSLNRFVRQAIEHEVES